MVTRQQVLKAARTSLAAWGSHDPHLVQDMSSARLLPGAAYSTHCFVQVRVHQGRETPFPSVSVRLMV